MIRRVIADTPARDPKAERERKKRAKDRWNKRKTDEMVALNSTTSVITFSTSHSVFYN